MKKCSPFLKVVAVAARNLKSAQDFANKFDIPKAYEGYEALAKDPNVEVVYVGSINPTHLNICKSLWDVTNEGSYKRQNKHEYRIIIKEIIYKVQANKVTIDASRRLLESTV